MQSNNRKMSVYLDKDTYDGFITLCNKQGRTSYDVMRELIKALVNYQTK